MRTNRIEWRLSETKFTITIAGNCINVCKLMTNTERERESQLIKFEKEIIFCSRPIPHTVSTMRINQINVV